MPEELPQLKLRSLADRYERVLCERLEEQRRFYEERLRALPPPPPRDDGALTKACDRAKAAAAAWAARAALADAKLRATRATHERLRRAAALSKAKAAAGRAAAADVRPRVAIESGRGEGAARGYRICVPRPPGALDVRGRGRRRRGRGRCARTTTAPGEEEGAASKRLSCHVP